MPITPFQLLSFLLLKAKSTFWPSLDVFKRGCCAGILIGICVTGICFAQVPKPDVSGHKSTALPSVGSHPTGAKTANHTISRAKRLGRKGTKGTGAASSLAGGVTILLQQADQTYRNGAKRQALSQYINILNIAPNTVQAQYMAGVCYLQTIQKERSLVYLLSAYDLQPSYVTDMLRETDIFPDLLFLIGLSYHLGENFDKAKVYYRTFKGLLQANKACAASQDQKGLALRLTDRRIYECGIGKEYKAQPLAVKFKSVEVNSIYPDYAPAVDAKETFMAFTSRRPGGASLEVDRDLYNFEDIYLSLRDSVTGKYLTPHLVSELSTPAHESVVSVSADGTTMLIYKDANGGDIYISKRESKKPNAKWGKPVSIGVTINSQYKESSAYITANGKYLYFSSDRPGGRGGLDIYVSQNVAENLWSNPSNLGDKINTEFDDDAPITDTKAQNLFFSSKGHRGMGGYDVYHSRFDAEKGSWKQPYNLGYPINGSDNDTYFIQGEDTLRAYYATLKDEGVGDIDIFSIDLSKAIKDLADTTKRRDNLPVIDSINTGLPFSELENNIIKTNPDPLAEFKEKTEVTVDDVPTARRKTRINNLVPVAIDLSLKNKRTHRYLDADVKFYDLESGKEVVAMRRKLGTYQALFTDSVARQYRLVVDKDGFLFKDIIVTVPPAINKPQKVILRTVDLEAIELNEAKTLRNIYFDFNKSTLKPTSQAALILMLGMLKSNPTLIVEISGHTDAIGSDAYNLKLSQRRAASVVAWLVNHGIAASRLIAKGYGETKPLATNDDEKEGREINRRVAFEVISAKHK